VINAAVASSSHPAVSLSFRSRCGALATAALVGVALAGCIGTANTMRPALSLPSGQSTQVALGGGGGGGSDYAQTEVDLWGSFMVLDDLELLGFGQGAGFYLFEPDAWTETARGGLLLRQDIEVVEQTHVGWVAGGQYTGNFGYGGDEHIIGGVLGLPVHQAVSDTLYVYATPEVFLNVVITGSRREFPIFAEFSAPVGMAWRPISHLTLFGEAAFTPGIGGNGTVGVLGHF